MIEPQTHIGCHSLKYIFKILNDLFTQSLTTFSSTIGECLFDYCSDWFCLATISAELSVNACFQFEIYYAQLWENVFLSIGRKYIRHGRGTPSLGRRPHG
jgi:hypothetical protein